MLPFERFSRFWSAFFFRSCSLLLFPQWLALGWWNQRSSTSLLLDAWPTAGDTPSGRENAASRERKPRPDGMNPGCSPGKSATSGQSFLGEQPMLNRTARGAPALDSKPPFRSWLSQHVSASERLSRNLLRPKNRPDHKPPYIRKTVSTRAAPSSQPSSTNFTTRKPVEPARERQRTTESKPPAPEKQTRPQAPAPVS